MLPFGEVSAQELDSPTCAAKYLLSLLTSLFKNPLAVPFHLEEVISDSAVIPEDIDNLLDWVFGEDTGN